MIGFENNNENILVKKIINLPIIFAQFQSSRHQNN